MADDQLPLHEFMAGNRRELLDLCLRKIHAHSPNVEHEAGLRRVFAALIGEIIGALRGDAGLPADSPLPGPSESAAEHGELRHSEGESIGNLAIEIGMISDSVGELAAAHGLRFAAREYQVFNKSVDTAICSAIERFTMRDVEQREARASQRIGLIAQELRRALTGARLAYSLLRRGNVAVASRTGDLLDRSLTRMTELVEPLLLAVHLEPGAPSERERVRLAPLLREVQAATISERDIVVVVDANEALEVQGDARVLASAIGYLVQSGLRLSENGSLVFVRARRDVDGATAVEVESGCVGLPERDEEVFAPLGLSIAREAVERSGGSVGVRRSSDQGCTLWIRLPP